MEAFLFRLFLATVFILFICGMLTLIQRTVV